MKDTKNLIDEEGGEPLLGKKKQRRLNPSLAIVFSFLVVIGLGTICFLLPFAGADGHGLPFIDALFLATSATCVTGLSTIAPGAVLSLFGQIVLAVLIEIGGLSFLTLVSFVFVLFGRKLSFDAQFLMKDQLNQESLGDIRKLIVRIIVIALIVQLLGAGASYMVFHYSYSLPWEECLRYGIFHSISSFNNAGFDLFVYEEGSLIHFKDDIWLNIITMVLIIMGGLGFVTIFDIIKKRRWQRFTLNTKIVLVMTLILIVVGTILFKAFQWQKMSFLQALFSSVTARTAGFASFDMAELTGPSYTVMIVLMFVGASPCSTGGGFKTTSLFILMAALVGYLRGRSPRAFYRKISQKQIEKTLALFIVEIVYLFLAIIVISAIENGINSGLTAQQLVFETVSAFATVGLSQGITSSLSIGSKIIIIITMFLGRLGPLTVLSIWNNRKNMFREREIGYVEEDIVIG